MQTVVTNTSASMLPISISPARLGVRGDAGAPVVEASGDWVADQLAVPAVWQALQRSMPGLPQLDTACWDLRPIARLDHTGAQYLWSLWGARLPSQLEANPDQQALLDRVAQFSAPVPPHSGHGWRGAYFRVGQAVVGVADRAHAALRLLGQLALDTGRLLRHPTRAPWRDISGHLFRIGATALPITALVGFLIGVVLAYLMSQQLRQFGADIFIVNILGIALVRELGPVLAAILIAGRSGSAITAQIGVMRVTEELDAMRVMGIARGFRLVLPRVIAMAVAMPLLAVWTTLAALLGGMLAADLAMGLSPAYFFSALPKTVAIANLGLAVAKSVTFGVLIALIACHYGLRVQPNTQSLGQGTTASVVTSITAVILIDALFAVLFKGVGI
jgi:phospholipid/cholesterol/gamma-HCH transport system permease protein